MLVTFRSKAHANITMFGDVAVTLLKLAGHSGTVPSAILAQDVPGAILKLESGLLVASSAPPAADPKTADDLDAEPKVPLRRRALPLLELLRASDAAGADVLIDKVG
jgi:hypothetical protein